MAKVITLPGVQATSPLEPEVPNTGRLLDDHRFDLIACVLEEIGTEAHQMDNLCELALINDGGAQSLTHALRQSMRRIGALADTAAGHGNTGRPRRSGGASEWILPGVCLDTLAEIRKVESSAGVA